MNLFNSKTLRRHIGSAPLPAAHRALLEGWSELIASRRIHALKETALHGQFTSKIVEGVLGYRGPSQGADYTVATEQAILRGSVDLALGRFGGKTPEILAPFELKGADTRNLDAIMPGRNKSPVQQAWEYAMNARGVKWVLVSNYIELRLYGFGEGTTAFETFWLDRLTEPEEYGRFMLLLSADNLLSGRTLDLLRESRGEDREITDSLYRDYKFAPDADRGDSRRRPRHRFACRDRCRAEDSRPGAVRCVRRGHLAFASQHAPQRVQDPRSLQSASGLGQLPRIVQGDRPGKREAGNPALQRRPVRNRSGARRAEFA